MLYKNLSFFKSNAVLLILLFGAYLFVYSQVKSDSTLKEKKEVQTTITYCNLELSKEWKLANLTFNSLYSFSVNEKGDVVDIKKIRDDFVGEKVVKSCVSNWKIKGVPDKSRFAVYFKWKHGKGWIEQKISGNGFTQVMNMENIGVDKIVISENVKNP